MATFSAADVKSLRDATGAGIMDAKNALEANEGNIEAASKWLREKGLASAAKRTDRANAEGAVAIATVGDATAIVELKSETDFVAKSDGFVGFLNELVELVAAKGEDAVAEKQSQLDDLKITLKENIEVGRIVRYAPAPGNLVGSYLHAPEGRGKQGVLIELSGANADVARDIAMHISFARPSYLSREEVPQSAIDEERATLEAQTRNEGKPEAAMAKIVEGKLNGFFKDRCLLEQSFVKDEKQTITQVLGGATIARFAQVIVGA
jgi:elongation factor Ts